jgi:cytochrome P450
VNRFQLLHLAEDNQVSPFEKDQKREAVIKSIRTELLVPGSEFERSLPSYLKYLPRPLVAWILRSSFDNSVCETLRRDELVKSTEKKHTLLYKALEQNEEGVGLSDDAIVKEAKAFIIAGTDTTAITSSYLVWAVLKHPEVKERLLSEVNSLPADFTISDVQKLQYVQMVVNEALRLYGAVSSSLPRVPPPGGKKVGDHFIPEGTVVTTQSFTLHRNPEVFKDPLKYVQIFVV